MKPISDLLPSLGGRYSSLEAASPQNEHRVQLADRHNYPTRERLPGRSKKAKNQFRRQQREEPRDEWRGRLCTYCLSDSLDCAKLTQHLKLPQPESKSLLYTRKWRVKAYFDVLHLHSPGISETLRQDSEHEMKNNESFAEEETEDDYGRREEVELDVFLFAFGPVVFWGFPHEQAEREVLKDLVPFVDGEWHDPIAAESAREEMEFVTGGATTRHDEANNSGAFGLGVVNDLIELTAQHKGGGSRSKPAAEKLAISSAIAQSCHLSIYESRLSDTISRYSHIPKKLAEEGKIDMSGDEISKEIGRLFVERNLINLEPELLDTPEFLWNDSEFEPLYKNVYRYLEVEPRIEVLNKRLSIVGELLEVLKSQQEHQHANHLEFIVVVLVALGVVLQLVWNILLKDILGWVGRGQQIL
ncbi:hypothetical protein BASA81_003209 [Batrachochytrium salamandrivorans]|nr:hypothetical protein BASA81_003209 [Batrachochytrium salamandrivorans]